MNPARHLTCVGSLLAWSVVVSAAAPAFGGRYMTIVEAETFAPGTGEVLQAGTWDRTEDESGTANARSWQLGVEFGLVPGIQVGLALPAYNLTHEDGRSEAAFDGTAMWGIWNLQPPREDRLGVSLMLGFDQDSEEVGGELGAVLERSGGPWSVVANASVLRTSPHDPATERGAHLVGRLGVSRDLGHGLALAVETEWLLDHFGTLGYRSEALEWGPCLLWEAPGFWILAGGLWDPDPATVRRGAALRLHAGLPF